MKSCIAIVVFDGIIPFHLSVPCAVFEKAVTPQGEPLYELLICSVTPGPLRTNVGFSIVADHQLADLDRADIVVVPSWNDPDVAPPTELVTALLKAHRRGAKIVGLCMGAFVLAACGLLNGRPATTHWRWTPDFMQRYPAVRIDKDVLYIDDGDVVTSAGTAASIDCCLHLVREKHGVDVAVAIARQLVVPPHRQGGQAQFIEQPVYNTAGGDRFIDALNWATENLTQELSLDLLADKACMSRRSFTRRFTASVGTNFSQWLLNQRLGVAQRFLEKTDQPIDLIAGYAGFASSTSLRRHFLSKLNTTPSRYRREFRGS